MEKTFWLSYDLSLGSDLDGLFGWLDERDAEECGYGVAVFRYQPKTANPATELRASLTGQVKFGSRDRIYLIWKDEPNGKNRGEFIIGNRKGAPWKGYALREEAVDLSE